MIVLDDTSLLHELLGPNDINLKQIEKLLNVSIYSRGNELILKTDDEAKKRLFKDLINQIVEYVKRGQPLCPNLIQTIHNSLNNGDQEKVDLLKKVSVNINASSRKVYPKSYNQALYLEAIEKYEMVFAIGPAGTGKTFLAVALALKYILSHEKRKLILTRPIVEAGENLGFLPGDLSQKINPYLRPLYDAMEYFITIENIKNLEQNSVIEVAPLAYMRGRTLSECVIILDEAQNTTKEQMKMFLTRIGEGSKTIITGDITQIDIPFKKKSGLIQAISLMKNIEDIHFMFFNQNDVVRNQLVRKIIQAYEQNEKSN